MEKLYTNWSSRATNSLILTLSSEMLNYRRFLQKNFEPTWKQLVSYLARMAEKCFENVAELIPDHCSLYDLVKVKNFTDHKGYYPVPYPKVDLKNDWRRHGTGAYAYCAFYHQFRKCSDFMRPSHLMTKIPSRWVWVYDTLPGVQRRRMATVEHEVAVLQKTMKRSSVQYSSVHQW